MRETVYYQRGAADPVLENSLVLDIVRQYVHNAEAIIHIDESGGEGRVYAVDENIILKVQRPQQLRSCTSLEKEAFFLKQLEQQTDVSVPRLLGYGKRGTVEYLCMTRVSGVAAETVKLSQQEKNDLLIELGKELRKIHSINQKPFIESGLFPQDDAPDLIERLQQRYQSVIKRKKDSVSPEKLNQAINQVEKELMQIQDTDVFVALHVNPYIPHVFVDEKTHKYSGIIDFGDSYIGHPVFDMWYWKAESRETLLEGYTFEKPVSEAFKVIFNTLNTISRMINELE